MSKLIKICAIAVLIAGTLAMTPGPAAARWGHGGWGGWHHGGGWGWGWGPGPFWAGYPYAGPYYYGGPYYGGPGCGYVRVWRGGHWVLRRPYRCW
jgi:hypothetical protein